MSKRKNADKSTPWGYKRVYIEEQNRYVFVANNITRAFQEKIMGRIGKINYPSVKDCLTPHKGNNHIWSCDIEDAFGATTNAMLDRHIFIPKKMKVSQNVVSFVDEEVKNKLEEKIISRNKDIMYENETYVFSSLGEYLIKESKTGWIDYLVFRFYCDVSDKICDWDCYINIFDKKQRRGGGDMLPEPDLLKDKDGRLRIHQFNILFKRNGIKSLSRIISLKYDNLKGGLSEEQKQVEIGKYFRDIIKDYLNIIYFLIFEYYSETFGSWNNIRAHYKPQNIDKVDAVIPRLVQMYKRKAFNEKITKYYASEKETKSMESFLSQVFNEHSYLNIFQKRDVLSEEYVKSRIAKKFNLSINDKYIRSDSKGCEQLRVLHDDGSLIQGSKTSSAIFELFCIKSIDKEIKKYCQKNGVVYTRYRDDLIFSSDSKSIGKYFRKKIRKILAKYNFSTNSKKNKIVNLNQKSVELLGVSISKGWKTNLTLSQKQKMNFFTERGLEKSENGMLGWRKYVESI